jgi:hypothetical protein
MEYVLRLAAALQELGVRVTIARVTLTSLPWGRVR